MTRSPHIHCLKAHPRPFDHVWLGDKNYEWRRDDRIYRVGDYLWIEKFYPTLNFYVGRCILAEIGHITRAGSFGIPEGFCILGLRPGIRRVLMFHGDLLTDDDGGTDRVHAYPVHCGDDAITRTILRTFPYAEPRG